MAARVTILNTCALAICLLAPAIAHAAEEPIVVTGRGLDDTQATPAYDVARIDRERITTSASGRIEDVLSSVAGFQQFRRSDSRSSNPSAQGASSAHPRTATKTKADTATGRCAIWTGKCPRTSDHGSRTRTSGASISRSSTKWKR